MRIGAHMRIGRGLVEAARQAGEIGCETIQIFAGSPSAWRSRTIDPGEAERFKQAAIRQDIHPVFVHTQYLLNLASSDPGIHAKSVDALANGVRHAGVLGAQYVVTHIGSHRGAGSAAGLTRIRDAVSRALQGNDGSVLLLLENSSGPGDSVGSKFAELRAILDSLPDFGDRLGICLDAAHLWGAGYDVSNPDAVAATLEEFDSVVGLGWVELIHLNDTHVALGSRVDRHASIGTGNIGERGFAALIHHPALLGLSGVIETPWKTIEDDAREIALLKRLRGD